MKTKKFLLATSGATIDGRTIDAKMLEEMASSYDPKTYAARLNIEHIRGMSGDGPFRAYGDVLELSTEEVEVNFNGKTEKRTGLYGVFDVTEDAKKLNQAGQKVFPSIEIEPNFAAKGFAYLGGCALTDSPASIATDRLQFNRRSPGTILLTAQDCGIEGAMLELIEPSPAAEAAANEVKGFFATMTEFLKGTAPKQDLTPPTPPPGTPPAFDAAKFTADLGDTLAQAFATQAAANKATTDALAAQVTALSQQIENTQHPGHQKRPLGNGSQGDMDFSKVF